MELITEDQLMAAAEELNSDPETYAVLDIRTGDAANAAVGLIVSVCDPGKRFTMRDVASLVMMGLLVGARAARREQVEA